MVEDQEPEIPEPLLRAFAPLHRVALGVAIGVIAGGGLFLLTATELIRERTSFSVNLSLLSQFFYGYSVTWNGALIGLLWGFGVGFLVGWGFAVLRNLGIHIWLGIAKSRADMESYQDFLDR